MPTLLYIHMLLLLYISFIFVMNLKDKTVKTV